MTCRKLAPVSGSRYCAFCMKEHTNNAREVRGSGSSLWIDDDERLRVAMPTERISAESRARIAAKQRVRSLMTKMRKEAEALAALKGRRI